MQNLVGGHNMKSWSEQLIALDAMGVDWQDGFSKIGHRLISLQIERWKTLHKGVEAQGNAARREVRLGGENSLRVELFHNPLRYSNVVASPENSGQCPLCLENLPAEERGITIGKHLVALPNPAPILVDHLVLVHREHIPQTLRPHISELVQLLSNDAGETAILYNGPACGASSPHHLHFQSGRVSCLPLLHQLLSLGDCSHFTTLNGDIRLIETSGLRLILISSRNQEELVRMIIAVSDEIASFTRFDFNLILWKGNGSHFNAALFPRGRHRAECFYLPEPERILVSPGSVEMGGLIVVPRARDFRRIGPDDIERIYREVGIKDELWKILLKGVEKRYAG